MAKLKKKELEYFEGLLNEKKGTLLKELGYLENNALGVGKNEGSGEHAGVSSHPADQGTDTSDTEQAFRLASRESKYLNFLEEALDKIGDGTFGICTGCEELIPKQRLEAVPTAKMCIDCKIAKEEASKE